MKIRIDQYAFEVEDRYAEGSVLTAGEAKELNRLRAENIRNNVKRLYVNAALRGVEPGRLIPHQELAQLVQKVESYARCYTFEPTADRPKVTWFERELRAVGREIVEVEARELGILLSDEALSRAIDEKIKLPEVMKEAQARAHARNSVAQRELEELLAP